MLLDNVGESPEEEHSSHWSRAAGKARRQRCSSACREQGHVRGRRRGCCAGGGTDELNLQMRGNERVGGRDGTKSLSSRGWTAVLSDSSADPWVYVLCLSVCKSTEAFLGHSTAVPWWGAWFAGAPKRVRCRRAEGAAVRRWAFCRCLVAAWALQA